MVQRRIAGNPNPVVIIGEDNEMNPGLTDHDGYLTIDVAHFNVHRGIVFVAEHTNTNLANNGNLDLRFLTGPLPVHTALALAVGGRCYIYIYEGATISGGTPIASINQDRTSSTASSSTLYHTPSVSLPSGTAIVNNRLLEGGATAQTRVGGLIRQNTELILKPSTNYAIRITNASGSGIPVWLGMEYYNNEHRS